MDLTLTDTGMWQNVELILRIALQVVLLSASAFFSGSEAGLFSFTRIRLERLRNTRHPMSDRIHMLLDEPRRLIISLLCGNELVNIASSANMVALLLMFFSEADTQWINILIMVPLLLLIGEITPKTFAVTFPEVFVCNLSARLLPGWIILITPLRDAVRFVADRITTFIVGEAVQRDNILNLDEFRTLVEESEEFGIIDATERILIDNMLRASQTQVYHIMTPRTSMLSLDGDQPLPDLFDSVRRVRHSRVPVYRHNRDNIVGLLYSEDLLRLHRHKTPLEKVTLRTLLRPAHFVPRTKKVDEMFEYFQRNNTRVAMVLSEYGGIHGIVTMQDVLTFIFGEISGKEQINYREEDGAYIVDGDMRLEKFHDITGYDITDTLMYTIGGVVFRLFDRLPHEGESIHENNMRFTVLEMDGLRIKTLCVMPLELYKDEGSQITFIEENQGSGAVAVDEAFARKAFSEDGIDGQQEADETNPGSTQTNAHTSTDDKV